jgi:hypothetical protein
VLVKTAIDEKDLARGDLIQQDVNRLKESIARMNNNIEVAKRVCLLETTTLLRENF